MAGRAEAGGERETIDGAAPDLRSGEHEQVAARAAPRPLIVYEVIRREGEDELRRTWSALAWSGLAAGLSMGFSFVAMGVLRAHLPTAPWLPLVVNLGYSIGFLIVILGRQQLFTENTLTPILPLLNKPNGKTLWRVARLWGVVLLANLVGAFAFAVVIAHTGVFKPETRDAFAAISQEALAGSVGTILLRAIFAGWLIALMVWLLPGAETSRLFIIIIVTYLVGLAGFAHIIAGSVEIFYGLTTGSVSWWAAIGGWLIPTLIGNILGGVSLVAALNHAQVTAGGGDD
ncbi:MAG: formate/nitrite transporter family protein [Thermomicrobia bacterium]|nr:formate/nitrite transporter family protein [Thermomicrobia bacterium]